VDLNHFFISIFNLDRRIILTEDKPFGETFGLSVSFLESIGINQPIHSKIYVSNVSKKLKVFLDYFPRLVFINVFTSLSGFLGRLDVLIFNIPFSHLTIRLFSIPFYFLFSFMKLSLCQPKQNYFQCI